MRLFIDGEKIREIRKSKNISLKELSTDIDVSYGYLSHIEIGTRIPSLSVLNKIADYLNVPIETFLLSNNNDSVSINDNDNEYNCNKPFSNEVCNMHGSYSACMFKNIGADYAIKINDDNLVPFAPNGSCVFIKETKTIKNKELCLLEKNGKLFYAKKINKIGNKIFEIKDATETITLSEKELENSEFTIVGKIIFVK